MTPAPALLQLDRWLADHQDRYASPFHAIAGFLRLAARECHDLPPISCEEYVLYIRARTRGPGLPFTVAPLPELSPRCHVEGFIHEMDLALLDRMVRDQLLGLIRHISRAQGGCSFLDYSTGPTSGLHGRENAELHERASLDLERVAYLGLGRRALPSGALFPRARYAQGDLDHFQTDERFDLISSNHMLEQVRDWKALLASASRLLTRGGHAFFTFAAFGSFCDLVYRLVRREERVATYDLDQMIDRASELGLDLELAAPIADPRMRFFWLPAAEPTVTPELQSALYDVCVHIGARTRLFLHHYGYYVVFRRR